MRFDPRFRSRSSMFYWSFPNGVKWLIISNIAVYLVFFFGSYLRGDEIFRSLQLGFPSRSLHGEIWRAAPRICFCTA